MSIWKNAFAYITKLHKALFSFSKTFNLWGNILYPAIGHIFPTPLPWANTRHGLVVEASTIFEAKKYNKCYYCVHLTSTWHRLDAAVTEMDNLLF